MPQLDVSSFNTQIFWLLFVFFGFYFIILKVILPRISKILKIRLVYKLRNSNDKITITNRTNKNYLNKKITAIIKSRSDKLEELNRNSNKFKKSELAFYTENFIDLNNSFSQQLESNSIKKSLLKKRK